MGLIYFIPEVQGQQPFHARAKEIGLCIDPSAGVANVSAESPSGEPGCVAGSPGTKHIGYHPEEQIWQKVAKGAAWIGLQKGIPIMPDTLERPEAINGHLVKLEDGNEWMIPVARWYSADGVRPGLPQVIALDENGEITSSVSARYEDFWERSIQIRDAYLSVEEGDTLTVVQGFEFSCEAICLNYYIGSLEISVMKLLTDSVIFQIIQAVMDQPGLIEMISDSQKKTEESVSDTSRILPGEMDAPGDTGQLLQTSN